MPTLKKVIKISISTNPCKEKNSKIKPKKPPKYGINDVQTGGVGIDKPKMSLEKDSFGLFVKTKEKIKIKIMAIPINILPIIKCNFFII